MPQQPGASTLRQLVSGGQTGVDRGALRAALHFRLEVGGWCPPDGCAEDGPIDQRFALRPTPQERSASLPAVPRSQRTEWNVRDAQGTLILTCQRLLRADFSDSGTEATRHTAHHLGRPLLELDLETSSAHHELVHWVQTHALEVLNVAGPPERLAPGIEQRTFDFLLAALMELENQTT